LQDVQRLAPMRREGSPRLLVALYAAVSAATIAVIALIPGLPFYSQSASVQVAIAVDALLVLFLLRGSLVAWWIGLTLSAVGVALDAYSMLFGYGTLEFVPKAFLAGLLEGAAFVVLASPALERSLRGLGTAERRSIGSI
jgi:hypothetical protein